MFFSISVFFNRKPSDPPCWSWSQSHHCAVTYIGYYLGLSTTLNMLLFIIIVMKCSMSKLPLFHGKRTTSCSSSCCGQTCRKDAAFSQNLKYCPVTLQKNNQDYENQHCPNSSKTQGCPEGNVILKETREAGWCFMTSITCLGTLPKDVEEQVCQHECMQAEYLTPSLRTLHPSHDFLQQCG